MKLQNTIGAYKVLRLIGEGSLTRVFIAQKPPRTRMVALKVLKHELNNNTNHTERFIGSARATDSFDHPNIVRIMDIDDTGKLPFVVMELISGPSLAKALIDQGRIDPFLSAQIGYDIALALVAVHSKQIIHRDVKPSNIIIDSETGLIKLTDFGSAKFERQTGFDLTQIGMLIGTPRYMSPEALLGDEVDSRSDLWALGAILYELVTGVPAFSADRDPELFRKITSLQPKKISLIEKECPQILTKIIEGLLEKDPNGRPRDAEQVVDLLKEVTLGYSDESSGRSHIKNLANVQGNYWIISEDDQIRATQMLWGQIAGNLTADFVRTQTPSFDPNIEPLPLGVIGRYKLEKQLGEGAMSAVFVAKHPQLNSRVALKILRREVSADKQHTDRFLEDARAAAILNHPNIVRVTDFDVADGVPFIVMELVDGWSVKQWLEEKGRLEVRDAARVARDIALGLGAAHAAKIVHRDVKPSNVLMDNRTGAAKLTDFGAAKRDRPDDQALTMHGQTIGTPRYMAPEQLHGEPVDPRTDLWALGATLYEMLAGQPAFSATSLPRLYQAIVAEDPPRLASLRPDVPTRTRDPGLAPVEQVAGRPARHRRRSR